ncbi:MULTISPECIES: hypothetical protein [Paenibacillus]|uniref:hypothetical protein n=1 Tax=Paenibacillus TaxID=44249 RepID=UPI00038FADA1|nr:MULTISPECIES: hypothetical protein [Paenibacillus]KKC46663.1 hypothetical protein VE23_05255 [Paenibacillus sp. D9]CDN41124.1 Putative uncharacterized protein [Paenibacillus sp. P22]
MTQNLKIAFIALLSIWASLYVGVLIPSLWRQKNFRGAIIIAILSASALTMPVAITLIKEG